MITYSSFQLHSHISEFLGKASFKASRCFPWDERSIDPARMITLGILVCGWSSVVKVVDQYPLSFGEKLVPAAEPQASWHLWHSSLPFSVCFS